MLFYSGNVVGVTTSGCPSPSMGKGCNISMGYVEKKVKTNKIYKSTLLAKTTIHL